MSNFWQKLNKPIFCLAPMEEVTDVAFREMFARYSGQVESGKVKVESRNTTPSPTSVGATPPKQGGDTPWLSAKVRSLSSFSKEEYPRLVGGEVVNNFVMFTEFINVDGLTHPEGRKKLSIDLKFTEAQRPIVAQIWGRSPLKFEEAAKIVVDLGFDGIDINMGCPQDKEIRGGACAALIREPKLAQEIISATQKGGGGLPVSVKTRLGYSTTDEMEEWVKNLLETNISVLTLHGRTKQEKSKVAANWQAIAEAVKIRDEMFPLNPHPSPSPIRLRQGYGGQEGRGKDVGLRPLILGNGDIQSREEGLKRVEETGVDGVMIGRGAFGNPWIFNPGVACPFMGDPKHANADKSARYIAPQEKLRVMLEHARLFNELLGAHKSFFIMRKHFKAYCSGFDGAHELRAKLMEAKNLPETEEIVRKYLSTASF